MSFKRLNSNESPTTDEPGRETWPASWREILIFDFYLLALLILAARLATCLHEIVGHGLTVVIFGGRVNGIHISLFGGGWTYYQFDREIALIARFLAAFGGILVNVLFGLLALYFVRRLSGNPARTLFLTLFAGVSVLGATGYTILGFYYQQGDPVAWVQSPSPAAAWFWIPLLILAPGASYLVLKPYVLVCESRFPAFTYRERAIMVLLTLGLAGCLYTGLYIVTNQRSVALDAAATAHQEDKRRVLRAKREALAAKLREAHPELSAEAVRRMAEQTSIAVDPEEVPRRFPLMPILAILYLGGVLASAGGRRSGSPERIPPISLGLLCWTAALAGMVLGILVWSGGWLYKPG
jgi:hypothetical protein